MTERQRSFVVPKHVGALVMVLSAFIHAVPNCAQAAGGPPKRSGTDVNALEPIECGWGPEDLREPYFAFWEKTVEMPEGVFLLIRKGKELGALRFTKLHRGDGLKEGDSTEYESYYQADGSGSLVGKGVLRRVGQEDMRLSLGYAPFLIERGRKERVQVGPWQFGGLSAGSVEMYLYGTKFEDQYQSPIAYRDPGFAFAATSARDVRQIDARDSRLKWFRLVEPPADKFEGSKMCMTREISLAVSALPK